MAKGVKTGGGSRKGKPNKITTDLRDMINGALDEVGGQKYLVQQALANPNAFLTLVGKTLPKEHSGPDGGAIPVSVAFIVQPVRPVSRND